MSFRWKRRSGEEGQQACAPEVAKSDHDEGGDQGRVQPAQEQGGKHDAAR
jgi:hypothetical protein